MLFKGDSSGEREVLQIDVFVSYFAVKYRSVLFVSRLSTCKFMKRGIIILGDQGVVV